MAPPSHTLDLADLFRTHADGLTGAVRGVLGAAADVQEILQEAFLKAWRALDRGTRPADPVAWVFVLTMNLARDQRRRDARRGPVRDLDEVDAVKLTARTPEPPTQLAEEETLAAARDAIRRLQDPDKEVFLLRTSGNLSFAAIGAALGIPVGTAKTRMRSALRELRAGLRPFAPDPAAEGDV